MNPHKGYPSPLSNEIRLYMSSEKPETLSPGPHNNLSQVQHTLPYIFCSGYGGRQLPSLHQQNPQEQHTVNSQ